MKDFQILLLCHRKFRGTGNCDNCDLVLQLAEYGNLTFMYAAMEGLSDVGASAVLSTRNNSVFLPLCDPELSYKNVPCAVRLCSDLTSLRIAFSIPAIPSSLSRNYLDQPGTVPWSGLYPTASFWRNLSLLLPPIYLQVLCRYPWENDYLHVWFINPRCLKDRSTPNVWGQARVRCITAGELHGNSWIRVLETLCWKTLQ